jgi:hypothetical protein
MATPSHESGRMRVRMITTPLRCPTLNELAESTLVSSVSDLSQTGPSYSFSVPISAIYSIIAHPPTLSAWYGSLTVNLYGGVSLPVLYFHDDDSPSTLFSRDVASSSISTRPPPTWGGEALLRRLPAYASVVKSTLEPSVYLINPSRADLEVHSVPYFDDDISPSRPGAKRNSILHQSLNSHHPRPDPNTMASMDSLTFNVFNQFSKITRTAQQLARPILSHRLARPILPHLPTPVANLSNATRWQEEAGLDHYDAARVYLAKWARIVAEEGERARRAELGTSNDGEEQSALGAWEVLASTYRLERPRTTRASNQPVVGTEWHAWFDSDGRLLLTEMEAKKRIFQRVREFLFRVHPIFHADVRASRVSLPRRESTLGRFC